MNIDDKKLEIKAIEERIRLDQKKLAAASQELAEELCPFNIGDRITDNGRKLIVAHISSCGWGSRYTMRVFKIKRDGTPFSISNALYGDMTKVEMTSTAI